MNDFVITEQGPGGCTIRLDHGILDDKGRKIGGVCWINGAGSSWSVRIHGTRDGVAFGALRHETYYTNKAEAVNAAKSKLVKQGKGFLRSYKS